VAPVLGQALVLARVLVQEPVPELVRHTKQAPATLLLSVLLSVFSFNNLL